MARSDHGLVCRGNCHRHGAMICYEDHHVFPLGYHGPNVPANMIRICCNAHSEIHLLLEAMLKRKITPEMIKTYSPTARQFAKLGHDQVLAYGSQLAAKIEAGLLANS
jgi:hypothetical protein